MGNRLPVGIVEALQGGLIDNPFGYDVRSFRAGVETCANPLAEDEGKWKSLLEAKVRQREDNELRKPLEQYRAVGIERMKLNFYGFDPSYHMARDHFVCKPLHLACHRQTGAVPQAAIF